jgi:hypothetical protein
MCFINRFISVSFDVKICFSLSLSVCTVKVVEAGFSLSLYLVFDVITTFLGLLKICVLCIEVVYRSSLGDCFSVTVSM